MSADTPRRDNAHVEFEDETELPDYYPPFVVDDVREHIALLARPLELRPEESEFIEQLTLSTSSLDIAALSPRLTWLHRPNTAEAVLLAIGHLADFVERDRVLLLDRVILLLTGLMPASARVAVYWMHGRAAEWAGQPLEAEQWFDKAMGADPNWPPLLCSLAAIASDRGDAERGLMLLARAGRGPRDGLFQLLTAFRGSNVPHAGRNDPCWCESGRKLKHCHRKAQGLPLHKRATWLFHKASMFAQDGPWREEFIELATARSAYSGSEHGVYDALSDPLVVSAMLFEGTLFVEFVAARGALLPPDELQLALDWVTGYRSLWEVQEVRPEDGLLVSDVRRGDTCFVHEVLGSREAYVGMAFASIVLPVGDGRFGFFGGIEPVQLVERSGFIDLLDDRPEPIDVVAFLTRRFAPPQFTTSTGETLEPTEVVLQVRGRTAIVRKFDAHFLKAGKGEWLMGTDGLALQEGATVGARLSVVGRRVTVSAMSIERMDAVLALLSDLGFGYDVIDHSSVDIAAELSMASAAGDDPGRRTPSVSGHEQQDPALAQVLDTYLRNYEQQWLDDSIPALGGVTPREAAEDPTRRGDLIALLNSFPVGNPNTMDVSRLRAALGM